MPPSSTLPSAASRDEILARLPKSLAGRVSVGLGGEGRDLATSSTLRTGFAAVDSLLGGGLPRGRLVEIVGRGPTGKLSLVLGALRSALDGGELAALVDLSHTACPGEAWAAGRLLVVRPRTLHEALRAADVLAESAAFALVAVEASGLPGSRPLLPEPVQVRLSRLAREGGTALAFVSDKPLLGSLATMRLEVEPTPSGVARVHVRKSRSGAMGSAAGLTGTPAA